MLPGAQFLFFQEDIFCCSCFKQQSNAIKMNATKKKYLHHHALPWFNEILLFVLLFGMQTINNNKIDKKKFTWLFLLKKNFAKVFIQSSAFQPFYINQTYPR